MLSLIPLMIVPLIAYNVVLMTASSANPWNGEVFSVTMLSGGVWSMSLGALWLAIGLICLFVEVVKSTRTSNHSVIDHLLSTLVFVAYLVEFLVIEGAATSIFFLFTLMAAIDLMAGFSVSIRSAGRDVSFG